MCEGLYTSLSLAARRQKGRFRSCSRGASPPYRIISEQFVEGPRSGLKGRNSLEGWWGHDRR